jgi:hypothetical protein
MRKPGTDENNVKMSDVLCDFCHAEWVEGQPMIEGHQGSCICGKCLAIAYRQVVQSGMNTAPADYRCPMCMERGIDRRALGRDGEPGWQSPMFPEAVICRRCIKLAAGALHRDKDFSWHKPA